MVDTEYQKMLDRIASIDDKLAVDLKHNKEFNEKKRAIVEEQTHMSTNIVYHIGAPSNNVSVDNKQNVRIVLNGQIQIRTACDHELDHVKFGSLDNEVWLKMDALYEHYYQKFGCTSYETQYNIIKSVIHQTFNIMEDIRIESWDGSLFLGRKIAFDNECERQGKDWDSTYMDSPTAELLATRFKRSDLIINADHKKEVQKIFNTCELNTINGVFKCLDGWLNGRLGEYIKHLLDKSKEAEAEFNKAREQLTKATEKLGTAHENKNREENKRQNSYDKCPKCGELGLREVYNTKKDKLIYKCQACGHEISRKEQQERKEQTMYEYAPELERLEKKVCNAETKEQKAYDNLGQKRKALANNNTVTNTTKKEEGTLTSNRSLARRKRGEWVKNHMKKIDKTKANIEKEKAHEQIELLREKLTPTKKNNNQSLNLLKPYVSAEPTIMTEIQKPMKKIIRNIKDRTKNVLSEEGEDIDIEALINGMRTGDPNFFNSEANVEGVSIVVAVDCSGSMRNGRIEFCRDLMATMFRTVKDLHNIDMRCLTFAGSRNDDKVGYNVITNEKECKNISVDHNGFILTPTAQAIKKSHELVLSMKGKKKIVLFLTDGNPQGCDRNGNMIDHHELVENATKAFALVKKDGRVNMTGIAIYVKGSDRSEEINRFKTIFGKNCPILKDSDEVQGFIEKQFKNVLLGTLR